MLCNLALELAGVTAPETPRDPWLYLLVFGAGWAAHLPHALIRHILFKRFGRVYLHLFQPPCVTLADLYLRPGLPRGLRGEDMGAKEWMVARGLIVCSHLWTFFLFLFLAGAAQEFPRAISGVSYELLPLGGYFLCRGATQLRLAGTVVDG